MSNKTPAMILQELSIKLTKSPPVFTPLSLIQGVHENEFLCRVEVLGVDTTAKGRSKKEAKQEAARNALGILKQKGIYASDVTLPRSLNTDDDDFDGNELKKVINYKGELVDICFHYSIPAPEFIEISAVGPPHAREFTYECHIGNSIKTRATASTKKMARQIVAKEMLERIKDIAPAIISEVQEDQKRLCDKQQLVLDTYQEKSVLGRNLGISIQSYNNVLKEIMKAKEICSEDLVDDLQPVFNENKLESMLKKFDLSYKIEVISEEQETVQTVVVAVNADFPLTSIGQNVNLETAKAEAINDLFSIVKNLIT